MHRANFAIPAAFWTITHNDFRQVALAVVSKALHLPVHIQLIVVVRGVALKPVEVVPAGRNHRAPILVQIFAGEERLVVGVLLQDVGEGEGLHVRTPHLRVAAARSRIVVHLMVVRVAPGQDGGARWTADRRRGVLQELGRFLVGVDL